MAGYSEQTGGSESSQLDEALAQCAHGRGMTLDTGNGGATWEKAVTGFDGSGGLAAKIARAICSGPRLMPSRRACEKLG